jgi:hypothetical protein
MIAPREESARRARDHHPMKIRLNIILKTWHHQPVTVANKWWKINRNQDLTKTIYVFETTIVQVLWSPATSWQLLVESRKLKTLGIVNGDRTINSHSLYIFGKVVIAQQSKTQFLVPGCHPSGLVSFIKKMAMGCDGPMAAHSWVNT